MNLSSSQPTRGLFDSKHFTDGEKDQPFEEGGTPKLRKHVTSACFPCKNGKVKVLYAAPATPNECS